MENIHRGRISEMRRIECDDKYFVCRQFKGRREPNRKTRRSRLDESHDVRFTERPVST